MLEYNTFSDLKAQSYNFQLNLALAGVDDLDNFLALKSYAINEGHKEIS